MTENVNQHATHERKIEIFNSWLKDLSENGKVGEIDPAVLRGILESYGANFEISENALKSLGRYSNKAKKEGLDEVWGSQKVSIFKGWVMGEYIPYIEKKAGRELHTLFDRANNTFDKTKHSGMMQFLGELTSYAAGVMPFEKYKRITENRIKKGKVWEYGDREMEYAPSPNASFPVDFPRKAIDRLSAAF